MEHDGLRKEQKYHKAATNWCIRGISSGVMQWYTMSLFILIASLLFTRCSGQVSQSLTNNECQVEVDGVMTYLACISEPRHLQMATFYEVTMEPADATCGETRQSYCTLVSVLRFD